MSGFLSSGVLDALVVTFLLLSTVRLVIDESASESAADSRRLLNVLLVPLGLVFAYRVGSILLEMLR